MQPKLFNTMKSKTAIAAIFYTILTALKIAKENKPLYGGIPNGHLYAQLMNQFSLDQWISIVEAMKQSGLITESNHLLKITDRGEDMHKELDAIYTEAKLKLEGKPV